MAMTDAVKLRVSEEEYLQGEWFSEIKYELIDGAVYAMAGASKNHERISGNFYRKFGNFLENSPCESFSTEIKAKVGSNFFYLDLMVVCDDQADYPCYSVSPTILAEVPSKVTRRTDETIKRLVHQPIPSLQEYLLIEQDFVDVEVCCRKNGWLPQPYFSGDEFSLDSIGVLLSAEDIYRRVQNEDVAIYLKEMVVVDAS